MKYMTPKLSLKSCDFHLLAWHEMTEDLRMDTSSRWLDIVVPKTWLNDLVLLLKPWDLNRVKTGTERLEAILCIERNGWTWSQNEDLDRQTWDFHQKTSDLTWSCILISSSSCTYSDDNRVFWDFCHSKTQKHCLLKSLVSDSTCSGFPAPLSEYDSWENRGVSLRYAAPLWCSKSLLKRGIYKSSELSLFPCLLSEEPKERTWRQERRFGATWIWWLRLLSDYNVEKVQVKRLEQRIPRITVAESLRASLSHNAGLSLQMRNQSVNQKAFVRDHKLRRKVRNKTDVSAMKGYLMSTNSHWPQSISSSVSRTIF